MIYQIHPAHGYHMAENTIEAQSNEKYGWKTVTEEEFYNRGSEKVGFTAEEEDIKRKYEEKYGKPPHHKMKIETIIEAVNGDSD